LGVCNSEEARAAKHHGAVRTARSRAAECRPVAHTTNSRPFARLPATTPSPTCNILCPMAHRHAPSLPRCTHTNTHHTRSHRLLCATPSGGDRDDALIVDARAGTVRWLAGGTAQRAFSVAGHILSAAWATIGDEAHRCVRVCVRECVCVRVRACVKRAVCTFSRFLLSVQVRLFLRVFAPLRLSVYLFCVCPATYACSSATCSLCLRPAVASTRCRCPFTANACGRWNAASLSNGTPNHTHARARIHVDY
jgi:hypothetical protein